jgi:hypothetical protein
MNREVMGRQMFNQGGMVDPMMEQGMPMEPPMGPPMGPPGMADPEMDMAAQGAMENGIDPAELEGMLANYSQNMDDLEGSENYETVINTIRGDEAPMEARYAELASMVGPEDAQATPESVLTLVQPIMLMNSMDQGIGSLAEEQMATPVEGPMAGGIMSTVDMAPPVDPMMAPPVDPMMASPAGVPPVNFNQGGAVQYFEDAGVVLPNGPKNIVDPLGGRLGDIYGEKQSLYGDILGLADQEAELAEQQDMTKAQMFFDVAQGALAFATPGERNMSPAERLAQAFQPVLGNISARAGDLQKFKQDQKKEKRALNLQALGQSENQLAFELKVDADAAAAKVEQNWKTKESALDRGHELLKLDKNFAFTKQENESSQSFQMRLSNRKIEAQNLLQQLQGSQSQDDITLRGRLTNELAQLNNTFNKTMQNDRFDFSTSERLDTQGYQDNVREQQFSNQQAIIALEFDNSKQSLRLKQTLEQENMALGSELRISENQLNFENQLERDGVLHINDISKMDHGHDQNLALSSHRGAIEAEARLTQNTFTAAENVLERASKENIQLNDQIFRKYLQEEMQEFNASQSDIDRAIKKTDRAFDEGLLLRGADQKDVQIGLSERAQFLDEAYKMGMLGVERMNATATKIGSKAKTDQLAFITNPERMESYANKTLGDETALYEQAILDYTSAKSEWDPLIGKYVKGSSSKLSPIVLNNVRKGSPEVYTKITGENLTEDGQDIEKGEVNVMTATREIVNEDGSINADSPVWNTTPPKLFDPKLDYDEVIGASRVVPGLGKLVAEGAAEITGGDAGEKSAQMTAAQKSLETLANDILMYQTSNQATGRVLKFVQEKLAQEVENIRPGGLLLRTDADAQGTFDTLANALLQKMQIGASIIPAYGGQYSPGEFSEKQINEATKDMKKLKVLYNEVKAFQEGFSSKPTQRSGVVGGRDQSAQTAKDQINALRRR